MKCVSPILLPNTGINVSCGQCYGCRFRKKRDWAQRLMHENYSHNQSSFITLTFNDQSMPKNHSLDKKFIRKWIKKLRESMRRQHLPKIRIFLSGEYGQICKKCNKGRKLCEKINRCKNKNKEDWKIGRPHYHAIVFGYDFRNLNKQFEDQNGNPIKDLYHTKDILNKNWGLGFTSAGEVTIDSCKYVANYVTKKLNNKKLEEFKKENPNKEQEFHVCSTGTKWTKGIGYEYYKKYLSPKKSGKGLYFQKQITYKGHKTQLPKYYKDMNRNYKNIAKKYKIEDRDETYKKQKEHMEILEKRSKNTKRQMIDLLMETNQQILRNMEAKEELYAKECEI